MRARGPVELAEVMPGGGVVLGAVGVSTTLRDWSGMGAVVGCSIFLRCRAVVGAVDGAEVSFCSRALLLRGGVGLGAAGGLGDWLLVLTATSSQATVMGGPVVGSNDGVSPAGDGMGGSAKGAVVGFTSGSVLGVLDGAAGGPGLGGREGAVF